MKNLVRFCQNVEMSSCTCYSCQILMKFEFPQQIFKKGIMFHQNPSSGSQVVLCGQTDGCDKANGLFAQFCERA
jgi:hypothetical protein